MRPAKRYALTAAVVLVLGLVPTCTTMAAFPGGSRFAAPLVCPSGTSHTEVVARWGGSSKGGSSLKWDLYCMTDAGYATVASGPRIFLGLLLVWSGVLLVLLFLVRGVRILTARGRAEGRGHAT